VPPRRFPPPWSADDPDTKLGQDCYNESAYADGHPLAYGGFDGRGLINKTPLDPLTSYSGGPHGIHLRLTREGRMGLIIGLFVTVALAAVIVWAADYTSVPRGRSRK
jgi:hypothetical protein